MTRSSHGSHLNGIELEERSKRRLSILHEAANTIETFEREQKHLTEAEISRAEQLSWLLPQCRKAVRDVEYFWRDMPAYSKAPSPRYLQAAMLLFSGRSSTPRFYESASSFIIHASLPVDVHYIKCRCARSIHMWDHHVEAKLHGKVYCTKANHKLTLGIAMRLVPLHSLEDCQTLWRNDSSNILETSRARLFILSVADSIEPAEKDSRNRIIKSLAKQDTAPKAADVCRSATLVLLLSLSQHYQLSLRDIYDLWSSLVPKHEHPQSSLTDTSKIPFPELHLLNSKISPWLRTTSHDYLYPRDSLPSATQTLIFPDTIDPPLTSFFYMDIWKPHGRQPRSSNKCCIWGTQPEGHTRSLIWDSIVCVQNPGVAAAFVQNLKRLFKPREDDPEYSATDRMTDMSRDWIFTLKCLYATGINDAIVDVRRAQKDLIRVRYEQMADPGIGGANFCLLYMQHLEHSKELVKDLKATSSHHPPSWKVSYDPKWAGIINRECKSLVRELDTTYGEASRTRKLVIEQHGLGQARTAGIFALLASIFVPIGFVASFFGMNTREINGSHWNTKYFFATAIPLAFVTVLIPLLAIPTINFLVRRYQSFRSVLKWTVFFVTFVLFVAADIHYWATWRSEPSVAFALAYLVASTILILACTWQSTIIMGRIRQRLRTIENDSLPKYRDIVIRRLAYQLMTVLVAVACLSIGSFTSYGIELLPYFAYAVLKVWRWRLTKKSQDLARRTTIQLERVNHEDPAASGHTSL